MLKKRNPVLRKLAILAAMLAILLVGAVPALAQGAAGEPHPDSVIRGTITEIITGPRTDSVAPAALSDSVVLVEEDPSDWGGPWGPPESAPNSPKGYFAVTDETEILRLQGGEQVPATFEDLQVGQLVEAVYVEPVAESYPPQGTAGSIMILEEPTCLLAEGCGPANDSAAVRFELAVEGQPPAAATFFAKFTPPSNIADYLGELRLTDPDGDGVYTYTEEVFHRGSQLEDVKIVQGTGTQTITGGAGELLTVAGEPSRTIKDFGTVTLKEDTTLSASVSFEDTTDPAKPDSTTPNTDNDGSGGEGDFENGGSASGGKTSLSVLPSTGGALPALGALGALLLFTGGLLAKRLGR